MQKLVDDNCEFLIHFHEGVSGNLGFQERKALAEKDHTALATWNMSDQSLYTGFQNRCIGSSSMPRPIITNNAKNHAEFE